MTYEEFKKKIESDSNYYVDKEHGGIAISSGDYTVAWINNAKSCSISTMYYTSYEDECFMAEYWDVISDFVATPIEDRIQEQKYYVKPVLPDFINARRIYLNRETYTWNDPGTDYTLNTRNQNSDYQTQFTMEEIKKIIPKEDMEKFQFIPVEED